MKFEGIWVNPNNNDRIQIYGPLGGDDYDLEYNFNGEIYLNKESVSIYLSDEKHALLTNSEKFGRGDINIFEKDKISICRQIFIKNKKKIN